MAPNDKQNGNIFDTAIDTAKAGIENVREKVNEATKSEEEKEAENKTTTEWIGDKITGVHEATKTEEQKEAEKSIPEKIGEKNSDVREKVKEATKSEEQKEAEKSTSEKIGDALPESATEAGSKLGGMIDSGVQKVRESISPSDDSEKK
ncbi:unnamed protein product [Cylindrotheca closterium]|uniref:Uncharacterized protein n=1 Tax=Cylindrotheca closterium TaxID=2856 RepID=A0AAD2CD52_9STRA|nr:unnamed protein product [Cylindrotheca closterium]CAJ1921949.1 unnamed protein product [Cylindrotheca closterium]